MRKEEKNGLVNAFLCYDWIVSYTNPIVERLYVGNLSVPPYIKEQVTGLAETEATKETLGNPNRKPNYFLSSPSINILLSRLIYEDIPLYKVGDREISCMADIGRLWKETGLSADILGWKEHYQVKAFLATQHRKILKELETTKLEPEKQAGQSIPAQSTASTQQKNVFRWCFGTWEITFDGQTIRPPDSYGLRYIHCLLANPSKEIHVSELMKAIPDKQESRSLIEKGKSIEFEHGLNESTSDEAADNAALKQYKERLAELSKDIKQAENSGSSMELEELRKEFAEITHHLKTVTGKKGRPRKILNQYESQRQSVKNCINDALLVIKEKHAPLYKHFKTEQTIKLGLDCSYNPPKATSWATR